jgi:pimeloyl-ACP methyl ester carboxylesterase
MQLHFEAAGQGEPLIILHGLFGSLENWRPMSKRLAEHFKVFALDQRNHGRSPHSFQMDYALMAEDVRDFLTAQSLKDACVLGHSMGGKTAMQLALSHPDLVRKLVIADMAPQRGFGRHEKMIEGLRALDLARFETRKEIENALAPAVPDLSTRQFLLKNIARKTEGGFSWKIGLEEIHQNYGRLTEAIDSSAPFAKPALFIRGETSDYLLEGDWPSIQRLFPQAALRTIPGVGHLVHVENEQAFYELVTQFLR